MWMFGRFWSPPKTVITPLLYGVIGQDVDRQIEAHPRRVTADRRRADGHAGEVGRLVPEEHRLAQALVLVVVGERHERVLLGHLRRVAHAIDRAAGDVDEALHAGRFAREHHRLEALVIDRAAERGVEVEARIVRDARHVDDGVAALDRVSVPARVANVARDNFQIRMRRQSGRSEEHQVIDHDRVTGLEQFRNEDAAFVAGATGDQDSFHRGGNESPSRSEPVIS